MSARSVYMAPRKKLRPSSVFQKNGKLAALTVAASFYESVRVGQRFFFCRPTKIFARNLSACISATVNSALSCNAERHKTKTKMKKKRSERRKHCATKIFRPAADPLLGGAGPPKFNQLETVTTCTYRPSLGKIDARNFEYRHRPPARCKDTHTQDR